MARSTVAQRVQIGRETTPGTAVPANKSLGSLSLSIAPTAENTTFRPRGLKYPTLVTPNKEWSTVGLEGQPTYEELVYPLASVMGAPTVTPVADQAGAFTWLFTPKSEGADAPAVYTVEQGDTDQAERAAHVIFSDWGMELSRSEVTMDGEAFAYRMERGITLTADPDPVAESLTVIQPGQVCIYVSNDPATLGSAGTRQGTVLSVAPSIGGRFSPVWYLNCTLDSFGTFVEGAEPDFTLEYRTEANANGMAWLDSFRAGATQFVRVEALGPVIPGTSVQNRLTMDYAVKVSEPGALEDEDGIYAIAPTLTVVHDPAWGRAARVEVVNALAAL